MLIVFDHMHTIPVEHQGNREILFPEKKIICLKIFLNKYVSYSNVLTTRISPI